MLETNFLKVVSCTIVDKYISELAHVVHKMFSYVHNHEPCIIFLDKINTIGRHRFSKGTSTDHEI
jgi:ATP-dependent 26S proteasome regulatory subunit